MDIDETAEEVVQARIQLDKLQEEEEAQAQHNGLSGRAIACMELTGPGLGQLNPAKLEITTQSSWCHCLAKRTG